MAASRLWPSLIFRMTSVTLVWAVVLVRRVRLAGVRPHLAALAAVGLLDTGGNVFFAAASSTHGLLSVVSILASLYPVVTVLLARFALGERVQVSQNAGVDWFEAHPTAVRAAGLLEALLAWRWLKRLRSFQGGPRAT